MKRIFSMLLIATMLLTAFPFCAGAAGSADLDGCYDALFAGLLECSDYIDIGDYKVSEAELYEVFEKLSKNEPMLFHISGGYSYYMWSDGPYAVLPEYVMSKSEYESARELVNGELEEILSLIPEGLDDVEKALFLHDYLCVNFEYDLDYSIYDIYNMLLEGTAVCMGYALLYDELLSRIGIDSAAVISPADSINHMWNEIELDGVWYHVDCTWDDPITDRFGKASHNYYLLCDDCARSQHENCVYYTENECSDKTYEALEWRFVDSQLAFVGGSIYGLDYN